MRRKNKMGAVKVGAMVGDQACRFDSKAEYRYALWLEGEKQAGRISDWRHHPGRIYLLGLLNKPVCTMEPDFAVWGKGGEREYHEVKGMATAAWRVKRALLEQQHQSIPYVVIDASHVNPPLLFDDRRKRKAARKKLRNGAKLTPNAKKASTKRRRK